MKISKKLIAKMEALPVGTVLDKNGEVLTYKDSNGGWCKYKRDAQGNVLTYKDSDGFWSMHTRDKHGNALSFENSTGEWRKYTRDKHGNELSYEDSNGVLRTSVESAPAERRNNIAEAAKAIEGATIEYPGFLSIDRGGINFAFGTVNGPLEYDCGPVDDLNGERTSNGESIEASSSVEEIVTFVQTILDAGSNENIKMKISKKLIEDKMEALPVGEVRDRKGRIVSRKRDTGYWSVFERDEHGKVVFYTSSDGDWYKHTRDKHGKELSYENHRGAWRKYRRDEHGKVLSFENHKGERRAYTRDKHGNELSYEDSNGYWRKCTRDEGGNELSFEDSNGVQRVAILTVEEDDAGYDPDDPMDVVRILNERIYERTKCEWVFFNFWSNGTTDAIELFGRTIWNNDNDEREWISEDEQETILAYVLCEVDSVVNKLQTAQY